MTEIRNMFFRTLVTVPANERALVLRNGKIEAILKPGRHAFASFANKIDVEAHDLNHAVFHSDFSGALETEHPDLFASHFTEIKTGAEEVAVIYQKDQFYHVLQPGQRMLYWTDAGPWTTERFDVSGSLEISKKLAVQLSGLGQTRLVRSFQVAEGQTGLLYVDNGFERALTPGVYTFWDIGRPVDVKIIDVREHAIDVAGQEVLTKDRVSLRVNIAATYRVTDPVKAVSASKDFSEALYRALQHAFRASLGTKTLDKILADKVSVDAEAARTVRDQMTAIGLSVGDISVKDVILPGEMREILNKVVAAEKEAEANVIRRREETSATRSLLNTARVMSENPVMLRLKELEALESIAEKVQYLAVHNGTQGLLDDLVNLRAPDAPAGKPAAKKAARKS